MGKTDSGKGNIWAVVAAEGTVLSGFGQCVGKKQGLLGSSVPSFFQGVGGEGQSRSLGKYGQNLLGPRLLLVVEKIRSRSLGKYGQNLLGPRLLLVVEKIRSRTLGLRKYGGEDFLPHHLILPPS